MYTSISLSQLLFGLSSTIDLVGDDDGHGKRVAQMAYQVGQQLGLNEEDLQELFMAALFHDLGVSSTYVHSHLLEQLEWANIKEHCIVGSELARSTQSLSFASPYILHHHDRWPEMVKQGIDEKVACFANIILLVDRVDAYAWSYMQEHLVPYYYLAKEDVVEKISLVWQDFFSKDVYDAFIEVSKADFFWLMNDKMKLVNFTKERLSLIDKNIDIAELKNISMVFANAVDAKSAYTYAHSKGVAALAYFLANKMGLSEDQCDRLEIAGLLHDLGKLDIPDELIDKSGPLSDLERKMMDRHSFVSMEILEGIDGMKDIALWASQHHEKLDGTGYPFRKKDLPIESRILVVADMFQALAQKRPYRTSLDADMIIQILDDQTANGKLDKEVIDCLKNHLKLAYDVALLNI